MKTRYATFGHGQPLHGHHIAFTFPDDIEQFGDPEVLMREAMQKYFNNHYAFTYDEEPAMSIRLITAVWHHSGSFEWKQHWSAPV